MVRQADEGLVSAGALALARALACPTVRPTLLRLPHTLSISLTGRGRAVGMPACLVLPACPSDSFPWRGIRCSFNRRQGINSCASLSALRCVLVLAGAAVLLFHLIPSALPHWLRVSAPFEIRRTRLIVRPRSACPGVAALHHRVTDARLPRCPHVGPPSSKSPN